MKRFVTAVMRHETNTFSPLPTPLASFGRSGANAGPIGGEDALKAYRNTNNPVAAFIDLAQEASAELVFPIAANAVPGGRVTDDAFEAIAEAICNGVKAGCDAAFLDLHGAMVTESLDDPEGELLRRLRRIAPDLPIAVALDFHANLSAATIRNATVVTGYCTYPHIDMYETGARAARTLLRALNGEIRPVMAWRSLPMLTHMLRQTPLEQPMKDIMDKAMAAERNGSVLNASVFGGFPLADIPHAGLAAVVVAEKRSGAEALVDDLLAMAWQRRRDFVFTSEPMALSIARAKELEGWPVLLVDHGDNAGAGGSQDGMAALGEVMRQGLKEAAAGPFWDPASVAAMFEAGIGAQMTLDLGGRTDMPEIDLKGEPLRVTGTVRRLTDGRFLITGPMMTGSEVNLGRTAVLDTGKIEIVVSEERFEPFDQGIFTHTGIVPAAKKFLLIKSRQHFRAAFEGVARHIVLVAGPGVCSSDYSLFPFKKLRRPCYPLDPDMTLA